MSFQRVVCGVDASEEGLEAARQGARLLGEGGRLLLLAAVELQLAVHGGWAASTIGAELERDAREALERVRRELEGVPGLETRLVQGSAWPALRAAIEQERADLVCVGTHGHSRAGGLLLGSLTTTVLHDAPCSVLVARPPRGGGSFPASIAVGSDGSPEGERAAAVAAELAGRLGAELRVVVATGGKGVDAGAIAGYRAAVETQPGKPVDVLVAASEQADLLVVGSRGLHGVRALGSVSERVAHHARCSVLVVR